MKHGEEDDRHQDDEIQDLQRDVKAIKQQLGINESRMYYSVIGTSSNELRTKFHMRKDAHGWFLTDSSKPAYIMEAQRAFGKPFIV